MAFANFKTREIHCKIVYFGPQGSGKTTNLQSILQKTSPKRHEDSVRFEPHDPENPAFFEFLPLSIGEFKNHHLKAHLYALPKDHLYPSFLSTLLKGIDGMIFVVNSALDQLEENLLAWNYTQELLSRQSITVTNIPSVIQYNKRDLKEAMPLSILKEALNPLALPEQEAIAHAGEGVMESLHAVVEQFAQELQP